MPKCLCLFVNGGSEAAVPCKKSRSRDGIQGIFWQMLHDLQPSENRFASLAPQKAYIFTFLLSSRLFIEPHELLSRVCHKCIEQQRLDDPVLDKVSCVALGRLKALAKGCEGRADGERCWGSP